MIERWPRDINMLERFAYDLDVDVRDVPELPYTRRVIFIVLNNEWINVNMFA